jgi:hypothetical protein
MFKDDIPSFVGRAHFDGQFVPGRIQTVSPFGLYHPSGFRIHHITENVQYLVKNHEYNYHWMRSKNGEFIENAVHPGFTPGRSLWYIGRIKNGSHTYLGKVLRGHSMNYENENGDEISGLKEYEVLVCTPPHVDEENDLEIE